MGVWLQWLGVAAILLSLPLLIRWGRRHAKGSAGGVAMLIGLAFGHLFDPARAQATETLLKKRETGDAQSEAGAGEGKGKGC